MLTRLARDQSLMSKKPTYTYKMAPQAPPPLDWEIYAKRLLTKWQVLLASPALKERAIQKFLEQHPCMVPGAFTTAGIPQSGHYPQPRGA